METLLQLKAEGGILHGHLSWLVQGAEWAAVFIDLAAILLLLVGAARFIWGVTVAELARKGMARVKLTNQERCELGRYILAGLELFIVSDVIHAALSLKFADLLFLLMLVIIRSITSYFLDRELRQIKVELNDD